MTQTSIVPVVYRSRRRVDPPCPCARCRAEHRAEPGFCEDHKARLARFKAAEADARSRRKRKWNDPRLRGVPRCCADGCFNARSPGERFCSACAADGWVEGDIE